MARKSVTEADTAKDSASEAARVMAVHDEPKVQTERKGTWTKAVRATFLEALRETLNVREACRRVTRSAAGLYVLKKRDAAFRAEMNQVIADAYEELELAHLQRGTFGVTRPVFQGGKEVGEIVEFPDRVALTLLRAHRETAMRARAEAQRRADEIELARMRLAERLSDMNRRMGGAG